MVSPSHDSLWADVLHSVSCSSKVDVFNSIFVYNFADGSWRSPYGEVRYWLLEVVCCDLFLVTSHALSKPQGLALDLTDSVESMAIKVSELLQHLHCEGMQG